MEHDQANDGTDENYAVVCPSECAMHRYWPINNKSTGGRFLSSATSHIRNDADSDAY